MLLGHAKISRRDQHQRHDRRRGGLWAFETRAHVRHPVAPAGIAGSWSCLPQDGEEKVKVGPSLSIEPPRTRLSQSFSTGPSQPPSLCHRRRPRRSAQTSRRHGAPRLRYDATDHPGPASRRRGCARSPHIACARVLQRQEVRAASQGERQLRSRVAADRAAPRRKLSRRAASGVSRVHPPPPSRRGR